MLQFFDKKIQPASVQLGLAVLGCVCFLALLVKSFIGHTVFEEWDGVAQYFSGREIWAGHGYIGHAARYWPPLYPALLALGDPLLIGKMTGAGVAAVIALACFFYAQLRGLGWRAALLVCALVLSSYSVLRICVQAENHGVETALVFSAFVFFMYWRQRSFSWWLPLAVGVCLGLAGLARYTSYAAAAVLVTSAFFVIRPASVVQRLLPLFAFVAVSLLWWVPNALENGSPFYSWQYLNVGSRVHPAGLNPWWWGHQAEFNSLADLLVRYPAGFLANASGNAVQSLWLVLGSVASSGFIALAALAAVVCTVRPSLRFIFGQIPAYWLELLIAAVFIAACCVAFVFSEALMPVIVILAAAFYTVLVQVWQKHAVAAGLICIAVLGANLALSGHWLQGYLQNQQDDAGMLADWPQITALLKQDPQIGLKVVGSMHPAMAYYAGAQWLMTPLPGLQSLCDVFQYALPPKLMNFAPRAPASLDPALQKMDYLVIDRIFIKFLPDWKNPQVGQRGTCGNYSWQVVYASSSASVVAFKPVF